MRKILNACYKIRFRYLVWSTDRLIERKQKTHVVRERAEMLRSGNLAGRTVISEPGI